jgi:hypothetical protein
MSFFDCLRRIKMMNADGRLIPLTRILNYFVYMFSTYFFQRPSCWRIKLKGCDLVINAVPAFWQIIGQVDLRLVHCVELVTTPFIEEALLAVSIYME